MSEWHQVADTIEVEPGVVYRLEAYVRSEQPGTVVVWNHDSGSWRLGGRLRRRFRRSPTCPVCLMASWSRWSERCEFCAVTAEELSRAGVERPRGAFVLASLERRAA